MSVVIRKIRTALQREYQRPGGIRIEEAIDQARHNLTGLAEQCLDRIDLAIAVLTEMTADPGRRPTPAELRTIHQLINEMLGCCATVDIEGLPDSLYAVGRLVGALMAADVWLEGSLTPAVSLVRLVRRNAVPPEDLRTLIAGIDQCAARISAHTECTRDPRNQA
ncbi:hypothetical protein [Brevundimonas sp.]|uniref:hypothetical protein n=1 Tax=Brevundimonas sp. TaxID=1871086 RepID=UPI002B8B42D2|nr:hypothetical protein [Brevundimonas sp.]HWQ86601.1 hypothetical protein [Brevundimonas sp.]